MTNSEIRIKAAELMGWDNVRVERGEIYGRRPYSNDTNYIAPDPINSTDDAIKLAERICDEWWVGRDRETGEKIGLARVQVQSVTTEVREPRSLGSPARALTIAALRANGIEV